MEQNEGEAWAGEVAAVVAQEVKRHRERLGMSAQRLSDACAEIGYAIPRATITKLENGYRKYVTVAELSAFAGALDVPLPALLVPLDAPSVRVLPGQSRRAPDALAWYRGDHSLNRRESPSFVALRFYVKAYESALELHEMLGEWAPPHAPDNDPAVAGADSVQDRPPGWHERFNNRIEQLRQYRSQLRALGHPQPPLPLGLEWVDREPHHGGSATSHAGGGA